MIVPFINSVAHAQGTHSFILSIPVKSHGFAVSLTILTMKKNRSCANYILTHFD